MIEIVLSEDGENVKEEYKEFIKKDLNILDFVGFVIKNNKMIAVFPKHYFDYKDKSKITEEQKNIHVKRLFDVLTKYRFKEENKNTDKYIGPKDNFESDYPFKEFFYIYDYYKKYGLYKEEIDSFEKNGNGKILWKKTIQQSKAIISNGNIIFLPIYTKKSMTKTMFITQCMIYVINYTINLFPFFLNIKPINSKEYKMDLFSQKEYVIKELNKYKSKVFKDQQKKLIEELINFFEKLNSKANGGSVHLKVKYFDVIWEKMVNKYLNDHFDKMEETDEGVNLKFKYNIKKYEKERFKSKEFEIDNSDYKFKIRPDHYYEDDEKIYIFDSKYYEDVKELNYKQLAYTFLIGNNKKKCNKKIYSALILPGKGKNKNENNIHLNLKEEYSQLNLGCNIIRERYLNVENVMKNYIDIDIKESFEE